ncbi:Dual specificity protein kinase lkh1 [Diplonema papillatum]|nr:Dual specificity protein kinase lkh1 [Diplonema papillatum]
MYHNNVGFQGRLIADKYRAGSEVGKGAFARVYKAVDTHTNKQVALKILKRDYAADATREVKVLTAINNNDPLQKQLLARMQTHFTWEGQPCIIFTLYGPSLRTRQFGSGNKQELARFASQLGKALNYCHKSCRIVHTDLKPENILLESANPSSYGLGDSWRICDLGSASFYTEVADKELITTRPYRAPEVILGAGWCYPADMFSLGVILYEIFTGRTVFECTRYCDSDSQHLQQMERRLGTIESWMVSGASHQARSSFFDGSGRLRPGHLGAQVPQPVTVNDNELQDLLERLLHYDPVLRLRADELMHHPFVVRYMGPADEPINATMPSNAYQAGRIRTPGCSTLKNDQRPPADMLLPKGRKAFAAVDTRTRSNSLRALKPLDRGVQRPGLVGSGVLGDLTNRPPAGLPSGLQKRHVIGSGVVMAPNVARRTGSAIARLNRAVGGTGSLDSYYATRDPVRALYR